MCGSFKVDFLSTFNRHELKPKCLTIDTTLSNFAKDTVASSRKLLRLWMYLVGKTNQILN